MTVPLGRRGLSRLAQHGRGTRWHNDRRLRVTLSHIVVNAFLIVCPITGERGDGISDLIEQGTDLGAIINVVRGQHHRDDLARISIDPEMQFAPGPAPAGAVLLDQPLAGAANFRPVLSTSRCTDSPPGRGRGTSNVSARRLRVEWSGTARSRPSRRRMEPIRPSV